MEKKINHAPPGWLVSCFNKVKLDPIRAQAFSDFRQRLCDAADPEDHKDYPFLHQNELWMKALDLLLQQEADLMAKIKEVQGPK